MTFMCYTLVVDLECRFISSVFSVAQRNVDHFPSGSVRWRTSKLDSLLTLSHAVNLVDIHVMKLLLSGSR